MALIVEQSLLWVTYAHGGWYFTMGIFTGETEPMEALLSTQHPPVFLLPEFYWTLHSTITHMGYRWSVHPDSCRVSQTEEHPWEGSYRLDSTWLGGDLPQ